MKLIFIFQRKEYFEQKIETIRTVDKIMALSSVSSLILAAVALADFAVDGFSYAPWAPTKVRPPTPNPTFAKVPTNHKNPHYPDLPLDKYRTNPFFQRINTDYPGLQLIHEEPFIFIVNNFLSDDECDRLIHKAMIGTLNGQNSLRPQIGGGAVVRTSNGVVCENDEVPTIRQKMCDLTTITDKQQLQHLKISRYIEGQQFSKHTDAWPTEGAPVSKGWVNEDDFFGDKKRPVQGCWSALNQPDHNNFMTCLVYLNDIPQGKGGSTTFPNIGLHTGKNGQNFYEFPAPMDSRQRHDGSGWDWDYGERLAIHPKKGMALLHFCSLHPEHGGICDGNTFHQADPPAPGHEKFVTQQFFASCPYWEVPEDSQPIGRISDDTI